ncbi:MAG TPA: TlpA disulfide reductase family protein, partial [Verrucomicrobiae bacterium]
AAMKKFGMRIFTEGYEKLGKEIQAAGLDAMHAALKLFPTNAFLYTMMLGAAQEDKANVEIAREVLQSPNAPAEAKKLAQHLVDGTKPYEVGKPLQIKFTALDGRAVDLAKLTGKIVLVEFWSTTCGPCVGRMPEVKSAYEKFHSKGLEVVAISLDDKETALRRFIKDKELPWPQYFDGKGWGNKFALQYGIFSIPTMWLVDKQGHLRDTEAENQLEQRISRLLQE